MSADREPASGDAYVLPRHPAELDRLDVQHYALREALGANYLAPGGWIELVEGATRLEPVSPASDRLSGLLKHLGAARGLDATGAVFDSLDAHLVRAGATMVTKQTAALPVGEWGGRIGSLMASDIR